MARAYRGQVQAGRAQVAGRGSLLVAHPFWVAYQVARVAMLAPLEAQQLSRFLDAKQRANKATNCRFGSAACSAALLSLIREAEKMPLKNRKKKYQETICKSLPAIVDLTASEKRSTNMEGRHEQ